MSDQPRRLLVASQKGGVGKTTTSVNLAACAAGEGIRTLLIDTDPLGGVAASLALERSAAEQRPGGYLWRNVSSSLDVLAADGELDTERLRAVEEGAGGDHRVVIVDSQPYFGLRSRLVLEACQRVLVVQRAEALCLRSLPVFLKVLASLRRQDERVRLEGILLTLPRGATEDSPLVTGLRARFGASLYPESIPYDRQAGIALLKARPLVGCLPNSSAAQAYSRLAAHLALVPSAEESIA